MVPRAEWGYPNRDIWRVSMGFGLFLRRLGSKGMTFLRVPGSLALVLGSRPQSRRMLASCADIGFNVSVFDSGGPWVVSAGLVLLG